MMNWYEIAFDIFTSEPGGPPRFAREQQQILDFLESLANSFANSIHDIELDEGDLFALGLKKIRDKIDTFEPRSENDNSVTRSFKRWMSRTCRNIWLDEYKKIKRKIDYETEHYSSGDYYETQDTIEIADLVDMDPLVVKAEYRSLMRRIVRDVLDGYPEHKKDAILQYRSTRKGRNGTRGFEGETADIASNANVNQALIRQWSSRFESACLSRYEQEKRNVKSDQTASRS
jgi:RNA polymerase sigma factor (sigma-70 family)